MSESSHLTTSPLNQWGESSSVVNFLSLFIPIAVLSFVLKTKSRDGSPLLPPTRFRGMEVILMDWRKELQLRCEIVKAGKRLWQDGLIAHTDGNISVRLDEDWVLITPSGVNKGALKPYQILKIHRQSGDLDGNGKPSVETPLHLAIYYVRPDVNAIVHAHPPYATAFAAAGIALTEPVFPEMIVRFGEIPLVPYATPGTSRLAELVAEAFRDHEAALLQNHGAITVGRNLEEACGLMEALEWTAKSLWLAKGLGDVVELTPSEIARLFAMRPDPVR